MQNVSYSDITFFVR